MRNPSWDEYRRSGGDFDNALDKRKAQCAFEHVPGLVIGVVYVEDGWAATAPVADAEGITVGEGLDAGLGDDGFHAFFL